MKDETKICRLCLTYFANDAFEVLDAVKLEMLKILPINLTISDSINSVVCSKCCENIQQSFDFKTACLESNDYLKSFVTDANNCTLVLEEIFVKGIPTPDGIKREDEKVCRFCIKYFDAGFFTELSETEEDKFSREMVNRCLPEIDLKCTKDPIICHNCRDLLQNLFNFVIGCLNTEERMKRFASSRSTSSDRDQFTLADVLQFESELVDLNHLKLDKESAIGNESISELHVKKEEPYEEIGESELHLKFEGSTGAGVAQEIIVSAAHVKKEEEILIPRLNPEAATLEGVRHSTQSWRQEVNTMQRNSDGLYACSHCPYQAKRKNNFILHFMYHEKQVFPSNQSSDQIHPALPHKKPAKLLMYHCGQCSYKSLNKTLMTRHCVTHSTCDEPSEAAPSPMQRCKFCTFKSTSKHYFKQHTREKHRELVELTESMTCDKCAYHTKSEMFLIHHMQTTHNMRVVKYECKMCGFKTHRRNHYRNHLVTKKHLSFLRAMSVAEAGVAANPPAGSTEEKILGL